MKKVMRSPVLKGMAFVLCLVCVAVAGLSLGNAAQWFYDKSQDPEKTLYQFESSFENSRTLTSEFGDALAMLNRMFLNPYEQENISESLNTYFRGDYYAKIGGNIIKNADLTETGVKTAPYYVIIRPGEWYGNVDISDYQYELSNWMNAYDYYWDDQTRVEKAAVRDTLLDDDCILMRLTGEQVAVMQNEWEAGRDVFNGALTQSIAAFFVALMAFIYLLFVTGRHAEDEEVHLVLIDRMFVELNLCFIGGTVIGTAALVLVGLDLALFRDSQMMALMTKLLTVLLVCAFALVMELILSLVRNLKNHTFVRRSFILRAIRWCWRTVIRLCRWVLKLLRNVRHGVGRGKGNLWRKAFGHYKTRKVLLVFFGYSALLAIIATWFGIDGEWTPLLLGIAWFIVSVWFLLKRIDGFERVVDALKRLRSGELTYKLTDMPVGVFAAMAEDINSLGDGMQAALQNEVRAERMKSELITNVSHDLKTPLTSILNYSDLLCQEHLTPEEANDYAKIIHQKGMRLKNLTSDLFDISKVQSGAEQMLCERLDACTLVRQALGEQDKAIGEGRLTLKVDMPEHEVPIWADGRKMSRVMENLIGNCIKYAMPGTRVFVSVTGQENNAVIELKNIANYAMDFDTEEITERFVRGDAARSTEGSGLGLAIAKSYVEACGGMFKVSVDGDLFKVQITFATWQ
nr:HAMP domain-containing sensor histidine kinase [uncultured Agathobaculum sp.]